MTRKVERKFNKVHEMRRKVKRVFSRVRISSSSVKRNAITKEKRGTRIVLVRGMNAEESVIET